MKIMFRKSNRKHRWSTYYTNYSDTTKIIASILEELYPTADIVCKRVNTSNVFKRYKIFITFKDISDEAHFLLMANGGLEIAKGGYQI